MSSSSLHHSFSLVISSLLLLIILISDDLPSAEGTFPLPLPPILSQPGKTLPLPPILSKPINNARAKNRERKNRESTEFLHAHNLARAASGAPSLKWDQNLARFASKWAKQRISDCKLTHSGGSYGENIFWYLRGKNWSPARVVAKWVQEKMHYNTFKHTCLPGQMCGHYTQIVWRATTSVGCATAKCNNGQGYIVVCEYSPRGNYDGESPFDLSI